MLDTLRWGLGPSTPLRKVIKQLTGTLCCSFPACGGARAGTGTPPLMKLFPLEEHLKILLRKVWEWHVYFSKYFLLQLFKASVFLFQSPYWLQHSWNSTVESALASDNRPCFLPLLELILDHILVLHRVPSVSCFIGTFSSHGWGSAGLWWPHGCSLSGMTCTWVPQPDTGRFPFACLFWVEHPAQHVDVTPCIPISGLCEFQTRSWGITELWATHLSPLPEMLSFVLTHASIFVPGDLSDPNCGI